MHLSQFGLNMSLIVGLTGGIACGKSTVCQLFAELGVPIIDADKIARQLVAPGTPTLQKITQYFGCDILQQNGQLNRTALRQRIFNHREQKQWLEQLLHPLIRQEMKRQIKQHPCAPYLILDIPLLSNRQDYPFINQVLVIDLDETLQIQRLMARDQLDYDSAQNMINQQISRIKRQQLADEILLNNLTPTALGKAIAKLDRHFITLAH